MRFQEFQKLFYVSMMTVISEQFSTVRFFIQLTTDLINLCGKYLLFLLDLWYSAWCLYDIFSFDYYSKDNFPINRIWFHYRNVFQFQHGFWATIKILYITFYVSYTHEWHIVWFDLNSFLLLRKLKEIFQ